MEICNKCNNEILSTDQLIQDGDKYIHATCPDNRTPATKELKESSQKTDNSDNSKPHFVIEREESRRDTKASVITKEDLEVIASEESGDIKVEVLSYNVLRGSSDPRTAKTLYYAAQAGMRLKMVRITISNSRVRVEPGALYYMKGDLEIKTSSGGGILKGLARKVTSGESFFVNEIHGSGEIYLEPTFGHFLLHKILENDEGVICDKKMFYAGTNNLDIGAAIQKNISSAFFGGEGFWQTSINGDGIAVLYSPVPVEEVYELEIDGDKLSVDGNFALMRTTGVEFRAEKSSKSWVATSVSGEGLLQTFSGKGKVWIAPTQGVYEDMATPDGLSKLSVPPGSMGTITDKDD